MKKRKYVDLVCSKCASDISRRSDYNKKADVLCIKCRYKKHSSSMTKHGYSGTAIYSVIAKATDRCHNKNSKCYYYYGGRGIFVCEEWRNDFGVFCRWADNNGYKKGLEIDRIDNDGGYTPENCRFVTRKVNANNRRELNQNNTTGYKNIGKTANGKYRFTMKGKHYGVYETIEEAKIARDAHK